MRRLLTVILALPLLAGCIHLPPEVAAVVRDTDPPGQNHFRPGPAPVPVAARRADPR
ncbi:MAG: hypothetical protein J0M16_05435 [Gammaproteobacteria bacterium]|nr:hypothetical protein [Gammaproteobacteria bacterium]